MAKVCSVAMKRCMLVLMRDKRKYSLELLYDTRLGWTFEVVGVGVNTNIQLKAARASVDAEECLELLKRIDLNVSEDVESELFELLHNAIKMLKQTS